MEVSNSQTMDVEYSVPKMHRRLLSIFIDLFLAFFTAFVIFSLANIGITKAPFYQTNLKTREDIQLSSGLYTEKDDSVSSWVDILEDDDEKSYREKKEILAPIILDFYNNETFFSDTTALTEYGKRRLSYLYSDASLFETKDGVIQEIEGASPEGLYTFYKSEINSYANGYLLSTSSYVVTTRVIFITGIVEFLISLTISVFIYYLVFPLWVFKRGRLTLGRKLFKIGLVASNALNVKTSSYVWRFLFIYFINFVVGFLSFSLSDIVSLSMLIFSKRQQDLVDYVFNQYMVDLKDDEIYLDYGDFMEAKQAKDKAKLENQDFNLKN